MSDPLDSMDESGPVELGMSDLISFTRFGPYDVLDKIAGGGMAEIYKVRRTGEAHEYYALKRIRSDKNGDQSFVRMLLDEARIAVRLIHPNIARVIALEEHGGDHGLILEFVDGVDLLQVQRVLKERNALLPIPVGVHLLEQVLHGLHFAHTVTDEKGDRLQVVHRDVSPGNVMVDVDGEVKIVDWGIARAKNRYVKTSAGNIKGKFRYMPPEQITNQEVGPYTDIYAAAVTFWELMAARRIYDGSEVAHFMMKVANGEVPSLHEARADVPRELERIYRKATAKRPSDRFGSALEFAEALREVPGRMRPVEAKSVLSTFPRDARIFETRRTYESAVARARDASTGDLEGALLRALEDPDRVERVDVDWDSLSSAEKLRKRGAEPPPPPPRMSS